MKEREQAERGRSLLPVKQSILHKLISVRVKRDLFLHSERQSCSYGGNKHALCHEEWQWEMEAELNATRRRMMSSTLRQLYSWGNGPPFPLDRCATIPTSTMWRMEIHPWSCSGLNTCSPSLNLVTMLFVTVPAVTAYPVMMMYV
jgi:hypothetical protein